MTAAERLIGPGFRRRLGLLGLGLDVARRPAAPGGTQIQPSRAATTDTSVGQRPAVAGPQVAGVGADDGVEGVVALHALLAPHARGERQPRHARQDPQPRVRPLLVGLVQAQQLQRGPRVDLDGVLLGAEQSASARIRCIGPRGQRAHALAQRLARQDAPPLAQVHLGRALGVGRDRRFAAAVIAGGIGDGARPAGASRPPPDRRSVPGPGRPAPRSAGRAAGPAARPRTAGRRSARARMAAISAASYSGASPARGSRPTTATPSSRRSSTARAVFLPLPPPRSTPMNRSNDAASRGVGLLCGTGSKRPTLPDLAGLLRAPSMADAGIGRSGAVAASAAYEIALDSARL